MQEGMQCAVSHHNTGIGQKQLKLYELGKISLALEGEIAYFKFQWRDPPNQEFEMPLFEILLLLAVVGVLGYFAWKILRKKPVSEHKLMLVAVRRREVSIKRSMELSAEERGESIGSLEHQWRAINDRWIGLGARYLPGFQSDAAGVPAPGDLDWRLFFLYELHDYNMFRKCVEIVEEEGYNQLRHNFEIRLIPGESMLHIGNKLKRVL